MNENEFYCGQLLVLLMNRKRVQRCKCLRLKFVVANIGRMCPMDEPIVAFNVVQILVCFALFFLFLFYSFSFHLELQPTTLHSWQRQNSTNRFIFIYISFWMILQQHETNIKFWTKIKIKEKINICTNGTCIWHRFLNGS